MTGVKGPEKTSERRGPHHNLSGHHLSLSGVGRHTCGVCIKAIPALLNAGNDHVLRRQERMATYSSRAWHMRRSVRGLF
eukprot:34035-Eustigmatos_ZCMA.PRE.1